MKLLRCDRCNVMNDSGVYVHDVWLPVQVRKLVGVFEMKSTQMELCQSCYEHVIKAITVAIHL